MKILKHISIFAWLAFGIIFTCHSQNNNIKRSIDAGDIVRTSFIDTSQLNLYQGNGRFGGSYGLLGLHNNPDKKNGNHFGHTEYLHISHWIRGKFNADYLLPLAKIYWSREPATVAHYNQHQSFYNGTLKTSFEDNKGKVTVDTWFDAIDRDIAGITINVTGQAADVIIDPMQNLLVHYGQQIQQKAIITRHMGYFEIRLTAMGKTSSLFVTTNANVTPTGDKLTLKLHPEKNTILLSYSKPAVSSAEVSEKRSVQWWNNKWAQTGNMLLPDKNAQRVWVTSMALLLSSCNDDKLGYPPPNVFTGNAWPFAFPQDLSFLHALLLKTGNIAIAKAWVEHWADGIEGMKAYTKRFFNVDGIFFPWVYPYGSFNGYHDPSTPSKFNFEIHNSGYLCRMAYETAKYVNDPAWTRKNAVELVKQTALFYKSIAKKESDGLWHLYVEPSMGQDELGGFNKKDYLCALYSAKYCFQKAIAYNLDADGAYATILKDGLAFPSLISDEGFYFSNHEAKDKGNQKHPVQLNELVFLRVGNQVSSPALIAYQKRYSITRNANKPVFYGWTLGAFLLAGSRVGDINGWQKDWDNLIRSKYIDTGRIQVYESSGGYTDSFYSTTNALIAQSLASNLVDDWFNKLEIAKCNPWKGDIYINKMYSLLGVYVGGKINGTNADLNLTAWKDCRFELCGQHLRMKKGQTKQVKISKGLLIR